MKNWFIDRFKFFLLFFVGVVIFSSVVTVVHAQTKGTTVIPPKFELFANPGDIVSDKVRLRNESDIPVTYSIITEDFASTGEEGAVTLEGENQTTKSFTLANWIEPEVNTLVLQPKEESTFNFKITVPKDAEPGGHYASILFSSGGDTTPGTAAVTSRIGTLVLLRVSGNVSETGAIETFSTPSYAQKGPIIFTLRLKNNGNVHIRPKGTIIITNLLNQKVAEIPLQGANVLPGAVRKMETTWDKSNLLGVFTATLVATYGQQNLPLTSAIRFTVVSPLAGILIGVAIISALIFIITLITGRKRFKKALKALTDSN